MMEMGSSGQDKLQVWLYGQAAVIRVHGRGSFKLGAAVREFGDEAVAAGATSVLLDMQNCVGMDSTFMGVVAGLAMRMKAGAGGRVVFVHLTERIRHLLCTLGLNRFVDLHMIGDALSNDLKAALEIPRIGPTETRTSGGAPEAKTLLDAHEALVRMDPKNLDKFRDVLEFLRQDVERAQGGSGSTV